MLPVITIVGRPNVGKSTLFNVLTQSRAALVADMPGVTRDRQYGEATFNGQSFIVVDTGGLAEPDDEQMANLTDKQVQAAIHEADCLLFMVDAKVGVTTSDEFIAAQLRMMNKPIFVVVNKADRENAAVACGDFYQLGMGEPLAISATQKRGIDELLQNVINHIPKVELEPMPEYAGIKIAVVGRPNVGKSTLINRLLGEERVVVFDRPGTTRDSIYIPYERRGTRYTLIDTAGVRRRSRVKEAIEKYSIIKTLQAMEHADVIIAVFSAKESISDQDLQILSKVIEMGKPLVLAFNKWDGMEEDQREQFKQAIDARLPFVNYARRYFISALHGSGVGKLYHAIDEAHAGANESYSSNQLTQILSMAMKEHQPPIVRGRRIRLRYAHIGGRHPLLIIIHGKQTDSLPKTYHRYLSNFFRKSLQLVGVPLLVRFKTDENPYDEKDR